MKRTSTVNGPSAAWTKRTGRDMTAMVRSPPWRATACGTSTPKTHTMSEAMRMPMPASTQPGVGSRRSPVTHITTPMPAASWRGMRSNAMAAECPCGSSRIA